MCFKIPTRICSVKWEVTIIIRPTVTWRTAAASTNFGLRPHSALSFCDTQIPGEAFSSAISISQGMDGWIEGNHCISELERTRPLQKECPLLYSGHTEANWATGVSGHTGLFITLKKNDDQWGSQLRRGWGMCTMIQCSCTPLVLYLEFRININITYWCTKKLTDHHLFWWSVKK